MIADHLPRYYETHNNGTTYEVDRSIDVDGHETAWMKYSGVVKVDIMGRGREGEPYTGHDLKCECDFTEGVGWRADAKYGAVNLMDSSRKCLPRAAAVHLRHLELRREYLEMFGDTWSDQFAPRKHVQAIIMDLIERSKRDEWLGEGGGGASFWGGYFYLQTVADVTGLSMGWLWEDVHKLMADKKIGLEGSVIQPYREPPPPKWEEFTRYADDDGWVGTASLPGHRKMAREWKFEVFAPDGSPAYEFIPGMGLFHDPVFGPDVEDVDRAKSHLVELVEQAKATTSNA